MIPRARSLRFAAVALLLPLLAAETAGASERSACQPRHEIRDDGTQLRLRADGCALSLADTAAAIDALLDEAWQGRRMHVDRATLELGRIVDYPWLSKALADAALKSPVWDPERGRGRRDHDEAAVRSLVDARRLLAPLAPVFARHGARARAGSVEKVLVGTVGKSEALAVLASHELAEGKKLPYDAILWLRLEPLPID